MTLSFLSDELFWLEPFFQKIHFALLLASASIDFSPFFFARAKFGTKKLIYPFSLSFYFCALLLCSWQVMQFGRIDGNAYTLDFQYPFCALQALAVALANVTQRLK